MSTSSLDWARDDLGRALLLEEVPFPKRISDEQAKAIDEHIARMPHDSIPEEHLPRVMKLPG